MPLKVTRVALAGAAALALSAGLLIPTPARATPTPYPGMSSYPTYNSNFYSGPPIRHLSKYVPQGLALWKARDDMIISSYHENGGSNYALLTVVDRLSGKQRKTVNILAGHVGGLATGGGYLWVSNTGDTGASTVRRYKLSRLAAAKSGSYLSFDGVDAVKASSYVAWRGGDVWVGNHTKEYGSLGTLYRYNVGKGGNLGTNPIGSIRTPGRTQGVAFSGSHVFWSQSWGRTNSSRIRISTVSGSKTTYITAPSMSQDLAIADGFLYVNYESGASFYRNGEDGHGRSINPITRLHYASVRTLIGRL